MKPNFASAASSRVRQAVNNPTSSPKSKLPVVTPLPPRGGTLKPNGKVDRGKPGSWAENHPGVPAPQHRIKKNGKVPPGFAKAAAARLRNKGKSYGPGGKISTMPVGELKPIKNKKPQLMAKGTKWYK